MLVEASVGPFIAMVFGVLMMINVILVKSIKKMDSANPLLEVDPLGKHWLSEGADYAARNAWAEANDFEPDLLGDFNGTAKLRVAVWKNSYKKTFLSSMTAETKIVNEFVTMLSNDSELTTTNAKDAQLFPPRPGNYKQTFSGITDLGELHRKHEEALVYLVEKKGLAIAEQWKPTDQLIEEGVRKEIAYVKSLFLWQLRGTWWFFVRQNMMNNKTIAEQYFP